MSGLRDLLFVGMQFLLPQHAVSRLILAMTRVRVRWFKNLLTRGFLALFAVDMSEAAQRDPYRYPTFNDFFTRALLPAARPIEGGARDIVSPVDGIVSECGAIDGDRLLQAKGQVYTLADLLAGQPWAGQFERGQFATIYLAPFHYHRIHMSLRGALQDTVYVPGALFSVNAATARRVPRLFARNERILTLFDGAFGRFVLVMVGALNVGSMATVWAGDVAPRSPRRVTRIPTPALTLEKGAELGRFNMGSTVILLFEADRVDWNSVLRPGAALRLGQIIGEGLDSPSTRTLAVP